MAGTIAARDNDRGTVGVAPGARLHAVRVFDSQGQGSTSTVICGIDWATHWKGLPANTGKPLVANLSLRGFDTYRGHSACDDAGHDPDPEHRAICAGIGAGVVFVVAAGNESDDAASYIPSRYPQVITVSALSDFDGAPGGLASQTDVAGCVPPTGQEKDDGFARYSNYGSVVDIIAPGTCVRSTAIGSGGTLATKLMSGTSMATPHVSGAVALYLAMHPSTTPDGMRQLIISSGNLGWDTTTDPDGHPDRLLDVAALLGSGDGLDVWAAPARVVVPAAATQRTFNVQLQRVRLAGRATAVRRRRPPGGAAPGARAGTCGLARAEPAGRSRPGNGVPGSVWRRSRGRYESAAVLADDLDAGCVASPSSARPVGRAGRAWRWCRRNPAVAALTTAVAVALVAGTVLSTFFAAQASSGADEAGAAREAEQSEKRATVARERSGAQAGRGAPRRPLGHGAHDAPQRRCSRRASRTGGVA